MTTEFQERAKGFIKVTRIAKNGERSRQLINVKSIHSVHENGNASFIELCQFKDPRGCYGFEVVESFEEVVSAIAEAMASE